MEIGLLYKTGDIGVFNGVEIEYIGRKDFQVKLRGLRIELGEIDIKLKLIDGINSCVTLIKPINGIDSICSYVVGKNINSKQIKNILSESLPYYMVPSHIIFLDTMPLTANGKVDKSKLPDINLITNKIINEPVTPTQIVLSDIWKQLLNLTNIDINSSFFELGGDSLCSIRLVTCINSEFGIKLSMKDVFKYNTIYSLATYIDSLPKNYKEENINIAPSSNYYPISASQRMIYYSYNIAGNNSIIYNTPGGIIFDKHLNYKKLENCINILIKKHEILRTRFLTINSNVVQEIIPELHFNLSKFSAKYEDIDLIFKKFISSFDLSKAPLFKAQYIEFTNGKSMLLLDFHHIICDGKSISLFMEDLCNLYNSDDITSDYISNSNILSYKDYAVWENENLKNGKFNDAKQYWLNKFNDEIPTLDMPLSYERPSIMSYTGAKYSKTLDKNLSHKIYEIALKLKTTPYMLFLSAYYILLYKYTHQEDIVIGTPTESRVNSNLSSILGMFVNTLALRNKINSSLSFEDFVNNITKNCLEDFDHQMYPFSELTSNLNSLRNSSRNPLFNTMFVYQNSGYTKVFLDGINTSYYTPDTNISKFDISLEITPNDNNFDLSFEYSTELFSKTYISRLCNHFLKILNTITNNIDVKISDIHMLSDGETDTLLNKFNNTYYEYDKNETIIDIFDNIVSKNKYKNAIIFEDTYITYSKLNTISNQIANLLLSEGIKKGDIVGILLDRSYKIPICMIGILKAGASYLVIDPELPSERIEYMLRLTNCKIVLSSKTSPNINGAKSIYLDDMDLLNTYSIINPYVSINNNDTLSCVFTSGSTGRPKGILIKQLSMINLVNCYKKYMHIDSYDNFLSSCSVSFDMFAVEMFMPLLTGKTIILANYEEHKIPISMSNLILKHKVDFMLMTPSKFKLLLLSEDTRKCLSCIKSIQLGGEKLTSSLYNQIRKYSNAIIANEYGPSETTACCSCKEVTNENDINIGKPLCNIKIYICDKDMNLCPIGIPGEICISGDGVSYGYVNNNESNKKSFISNPFDNRHIIQNRRYWQI